MTQQEENSQKPGQRHMIQSEPKTIATCIFLWCLTYGIFCPKSPESGSFTAVLRLKWGGDHAIFLPRRNPLPVGIYIHITQSFLTTAATLPLADRRVYFRSISLSVYRGLSTRAYEYETAVVPATTLDLFVYYFADVKHGPPRFIFLTSPIMPSLLRARLPPIMPVGSSRPIAR